MREDTKTCNLFKSEIEALIEHHARHVSEDLSGRLDRMSYLHKRLKAFNEPVTTGAAISDNQDASKGWVSN